MIRLHKILISTIAVIFISLCFNIEAGANNSEGNCLPRLGVDSNETKKNISLYHEYYKQGNHADALPFWRYVFANAPGAYKFVLNDGIKMMEALIDSAETAELRLSYFDTIMMIYDKRMECFGEEGFLMGRKAYHTNKYYPGRIKEILDLYNKAWELEQNKLEYFLLSNYFQVATKAYKKGIISKSDVIDIYQKLNDVIDDNAAKGSDNEEKYGAQRPRLEKILIKNEIITDCNAAVDIYKEQYENDPDNPELWQSIFNLLRSTKCTGEPLFIEVTKKLISVDSSANKAYFIAIAEMENAHISEAIKYFKLAIKFETEDSKTAQYHLELGRLYYSKAKDFPAARVHARKAITLRSGWGEPYLLIGDCYGSSGPLCGSGEGFDSQVVIWPAMDMYEKAKSVEPSLAKIANKRIAYYEEFLPIPQDCFFRDLAEGDPYTVACWINEETTVRIKK
ncbi:MAG: hypothetical protein IIA45_05240 [Bacteroidetes bacterium]|nr:hypothetical protein [Bacteroidota bacterium]